MQKSKVDFFREETNKIVEQFLPANQRYFDNLRTYLITAGLFYDEEEINEQVYEMANDLLEAQKNGESAEDFFGKDAKSNANQLIQHFQKTSWSGRLKISGIVLVVIWLIELMRDFSKQGVFTLNLLKYGLMGIASWFFVVVIFKIFHRTILISSEKESKKKKISSFLLLWLFAFLSIGCLILIMLFTPNFGVIKIFYPWDILCLLVVMLGSSVTILVKKWQEFYAMIVMIFAFGLTGLLIRVPFFARLLSEKEKMYASVGLIVIGYLIYLGFSTYLVKKTPKKKIVD